MKKVRYLFAALAFLPLMTACSDDDENVGEPVVTLSTTTLSALMGDSLDYTVNCSSQNDVALSVVKVQLYYDNELVSEQTLRTKTAGDYTGRIAVPYYKSIPNGTAELRFTLVDVSLATQTKSVDVELTRPEFSSIYFVCTDGNTYEMSPSTDDPYQFSVTVPSTSTVVKGHFVTPKIGNYGQPLTIGFNGTEAEVGNSGDFTMTAEEAGNIEVTFNTRYFDYGPQYEAEVKLIQFSTDGEAQILNMEQGKSYQFEGNSAMATSSWYYDPDYLQDNGDGTFTFLALTGSYRFTVDFTNQYFRICPVDDSGEPASLQLNGSGTIWIIGSAGVNKPTWSAINHGWWTGAENDIAMAPISLGKYQCTLTIGKQLNKDDVNFKFFGQANWGVEFGAVGSTFYLTTDSPYFKVGENDGNISLADGAEDLINDGDTFVFTIDLTGGYAPGTLTVTKQ
ncbi:MAG: DUF5121 domain-containing protein [Prevotella sp.]|jgi:hypothetical protein